MEDRHLFENLDIVRILAICTQGISLSSEEEEKLHAWLQESPANQRVLEQLHNPYTLSHALSNFRKSDTENQLDRINLILDKRTRVVRFRPMTIPAAAVILLVAFLCFFTYTRLEVKSTQEMIDQFKPGREMAILKLDNGSSVLLDDKKMGVKTDNGTPVYLDGTVLADATVPSKVLTLEVPKGAQYQVNLPDGSKVWLNAASTLSYPTAFTGARREVRLTGEAYFEISKDIRKPFIVNSRDQQVQVLGTVFNVNSYTDRDNVETTLIEGAVLVNQLRLTPGQRSLISANSAKVLPANMEAATAWKKGYFLFDNEALETILATLSRWYGVDFEYAEASTKQLPFWGSIDKNQPLTKTLAFIETTGQVKFDYRDGRILVRERK